MSQSGILRVTGGGGGGVTSIEGDSGGQLTGDILLTGGSTGAAFNGAGSTLTMAFSGITANDGTISLSTDAAATTVNLGTGAAAKTVTVGSTTSTSSLALKYGTSDFTLASATGTVMSALDTGEITKPLQPAFLCYLSTPVSNVTGDGTNYAIAFDAESFDQGGNVASGVFTAPVAGKYFFYGAVQFSGILSGHTTCYMLITKNSFAEYSTNPYMNPYATAATSPAGTLGINGSQMFTLAASDTVRLYLNVTGSTKVINISGNSGTLGNGYPTQFGGYLIC